ncbi:hypothetical protein ACIBO2_18575 [Nonomuraea sp. NPDC050022]|uniref:hypothetical protein n=1 Tax=Nonomuraea sp. NPDC050022 TaxID=3364358 RepID=UPI00379F6E1C
MTTVVVGDEAHHVALGELVLQEWDVRKITEPLKEAVFPWVDSASFWLLDRVSGRASMWCPAR